MDKIFAIEYLRNMDLTLWQSEGYTRGHWNIAPNDADTAPKSFSSLKNLWSWWFAAIYCEIRCELSAHAHVEMWRQHSKRREAIHRWIQSDGAWSLDRETTRELRVFTGNVDAVARTRASEFAPLIWSRPATCVLSRTGELLIGEERKLLAEATRVSPPEPRARRRM